MKRLLCDLCTTWHTPSLLFTSTVTRKVTGSGLKPAHHHLQHLRRHLPERAGAITARILPAVCIHRLQHLRRDLRADAKRAAV
jgi:hypothetical protein